MNVQLPEEEAGNIAFHIVNAQSEQANMEETMLSVRALKDILAMLGYLFPEKKVDKDSMLYLRFVTHLQYVQEEMGASANQDELLYLTLHISRVY